MSNRVSTYQINMNGKEKWWPHFENWFRILIVRVCKVSQVPNS